MLKNDLFIKDVRITNKGSTYVIRTNGSCSAVFPGGSVRSIGRFVKNGITIEYHCIRNSKKHLMRKLDAYGVNEFIWREIQPDIIIFDVTDIGKRFAISYSDSKSVIKYLTFKEQGFETQVFIPVESMNEIGKANQVLRTDIKIIHPQVKKPSVETPSLF